MSGDSDGYGAAFCPACDVSLDLHDGPDTCDIAMRRAALIDLFYGANIRVTPPREVGRMTTRTLADLSDVHMARTVTILRDGKPAIAGVLVGTNHMGSRVALVLDVLGMRVRLDPLPGTTACTVSPKGPPK